jgi:diguanylate cyclase (GGDEF)-like protein
MRILIVEDDAILSDVLSRSLNEQRYVVDIAEDGQMGLESSQLTPYDLILMDVELPKLDGVTLCQKLRSQGCSTPILLMTAKEATRDRIRGLDAGADDYLIKPLDLGELQARVRALLRRGSGVATPVLEVGQLQLDPSTCQVTYAGQPLSLTPKEYSLLELFLRNAKRVFSRGDIIEHLWTFDEPPQEESVKSHIKGLRQKLKTVGAADWIENVYGLGYRLKEGIEKLEATQSEAPPAIESEPQPQHTELDREITSSVEQQYNQAVEQLWKQHEDLMLQRVELLRQAKHAIETQTLSVEIRRAAEQAAHKLAGVLGMFDRQEGTQIARQIEHLLEGETSLLPAQEQDVRSLIQALSDSFDLEKSQSNSPAPPILLDHKTADGEIAATTTLPPLATEPEIKVNTLEPAAIPPPSALQSWNILAIDDDPIVLAMLKQLLEPWGMRVTGLDNPLQFWAVLPSMMPDLLILDVEMPQISGIALCQAVRANPNWQGIPVIFLTAHQEVSTIQQIFAAGADDYVTKPVVGQELLTRITTRLERIRLLQTLSVKDPVTGLMNQSESSRLIVQLLDQAREHPVCLITLTITELRRINIQYGHEIGNQVLQQWGRLLQASFRNQEVLGYWGHGEFVIGISNMTKQAVQDHLSDLLKILRQQVFTVIHHGASERHEAIRFQAICNFAVVEYPCDGLTLQSLYQAASLILDQRSVNERGFS